MPSRPPCRCQAGARLIGSARHFRGEQRLSMLALLDRPDVPAMVLSQYEADLASMARLEVAAAEAAGYDAVVDRAGDLRGFPSFSSEAILEALRSQREGE
jgi:hypothetical protein